MTRTSLSNKQLTTEQYANAIAVVGLEGRFPKSPDLEQFWQNLAAGEHLLTHSTEEELLAAGVTKEEQADPNFVPYSAKIEHIDLFDAEFFGYSPKEAEITSPQLRFMLESTYHALEKAGYPPYKFSGDVALFAGIGHNTYFFENIQSHPDIQETLGRKTLRFGNDLAFTATQISYKLNLTGASVSLATACSTSLVGLHLAKQSLLNYECDLAVVSAAQISAGHDRGYQYMPGGIYSKDGHCRAFDVEASGTVSGNGCGTLVLKRLADAESDNDLIHAVILGSALNNDGNDKVGFAAPSVNGQSAVIAEAQMNAGIEPSQVTYVEAHGTGTPIGDPIEIAALAEAFFASETPCGVGSLKSSLGHMGSAAGIGACIKTILALKHKQIPATLHCRQANPDLALETTPFYINTALKPWPDSDAGRVAGVSSFGMGGTNAHIILRDWEYERQSPLPLKPFYMATLSARTEEGLKQRFSDLAHYLAHGQDKSADIEYTLNVARDEFNWRKSIVYSDIQTLENACSEIASGQSNSGRQAAGKNNIAFMFTGQGAQYSGMAESLYRSNPLFRYHLEQCALILQTQDIVLNDVLFSADFEQQLNSTQFGQAAIFSVEYALANVLLSWGIFPNAMIGHSLGEYVAATLAGVFNLQDALQLMVTRGQLMHAAHYPSNSNHASSITESNVDQPGKMLAVQMSAEQAQAQMSASLSLAAINGHESVVVSGPAEAIEQFIEGLPKNVVRTVINQQYGFHSQIMENALSTMKQQLQKTQFYVPHTPFVSNLTGTWITDEQAVSVDYWLMHMRQPVQFWPGIETLLGEGITDFIEVGPNAVLQGMIRKEQLSGLVSEDIRAYCLLPTARRAEAGLDSQQHLLTVVGQLWEAGNALHWDGFYTQDAELISAVQAGDEVAPRGVIQALPGYPFQRQRYWIEKRDSDDPFEPDLVRDRAKDARRCKAEDKALAPHLFTPVWQQTATLTKPANEVDEKRSWLLVGSDHPVIEALLTELDNQKQLVTRWNGTVNQVMSEDEKSALELAMRDAPTHIIVLDPILAKRPESDSDWEYRPDEFSSSANVFYPLLYTLQAIKAHAPVVEQHLMVLSRGMTNLDGSESIKPWTYANAALTKVFGQEAETIKTAFADVKTLGKTASCKDYSDVAPNIINEIHHCLPEEMVCFRGRNRLVRRFSQVPEPEGETTIKAKGNYLITGGLGGIGRQLAKYLSEHYQANLILTGRNAPVYDSEDTESTSCMEDEELTGFLQHIQNQGNRVLLYPCDVADADNIADLQQWLAEKLGRIDGIVHAAGVAGGRILELVDKEQLQATFGAKVQGTHQLIKQFTGWDLDFVLLCSSQNALKGGVGRADYAAGNAYMDGLAHALADNSAFPVISVNWNRWLETGMAFSLHKAQGRTVKGPTSDTGVTNDEGQKVFATLLQLSVLNSPVAQAIVSKTDFDQVMSQSRDESWATRAKKLQVEDPEQAQAESDGDASATESPAQLNRPSHLSAEFVAPSNEVEEGLQTIWKQLLGIHPIGIHDPYFELGGNSLLLAQMAQGINQQFDTQFNVQQLLGAQTIDTQAELILEELIKLVDVDELEDLLDDLD